MNECDCICTNLFPLFLDPRFSEKQTDRLASDPQPDKGATKPLLITQRTTQLMNKLPAYLTAKQTYEVIKKRPGMIV